MENNQTGRPKSGTVIGILNIIFNGFGIFGSIISIFMFSFLNSLFKGLLSEVSADFFWIMQSMSSFFTLLSLVIAVQFVSNALGLAGGIALLKDNRNALLLCNLYAAISIVIAIATYFISLNMIRSLFNNPEFTRYLSSEDMFMLSIVKRVVPGFAGFFSILMSSAYPVVVLVLLNRPKIRNFYQSSTPEKQ